MSNLWDLSHIRPQPDSVLEGETISAMFWNAAAQRADKVWLREKHLGIWRSWTWAQVATAVQEVGDGLMALGLAAGDTASILSNTVIDWVLADLAVLSAGGVSNGIYPTDAATQVHYLCEDSRTSVLFVEDDEQLDKALEVRGQLPLLKKIIVFDMEGLRDLDDPGVMSMAALRELGRRFHAEQPQALAQRVAACTPDDLAILVYTSGTTGKPKGVVRDHGGHAVALRWSMEAVYGTQPGDVFWAASDVGWVVGHSYIVYGPLLQGCTTILYEGKPVGTPDAGAFWRVCAEHKVNVLFTAPTAFRAIKKEDPGGALVKKYDLSRFRMLFLAGERGDPDTIEWAGKILGVPVIDNWWQTELGWPAISNCMGIEPLPVRPGSPTKPVPGFDIQILDEDGREKAADDIGSLVIKLPLPPGGLTTLWNNDAGFVETYLERYPGYYLSGDAGYFDADGYGWVMARIDDIINVAGHRLSTGQMEEILSAHPAVAEAAVVGVVDALKGQVPVGLVVLKSGVTQPEAEICAELVAKVRAQLGAVADFKSVQVINRLPKTRSGKVLRVTIRSMADGDALKVPATIEDDSVLPEISAALKTLGYPRSSV